MEYLDVLDRNGNSMGRIKSRSRVHWDGDWHRTVHVWITNGRGEILIQKRGPDKETHPGCWDVSCAGHVGSGDSSRMAAVREAREELGMTLSPLELRLIATVKSAYTDGNLHDNEIVDVFVVQREIRPEKLKIQEDEVADVSMISVRELKRKIAGKDPSFVSHKEEYQRLFDYLAVK